MYSFEINTTLLLVESTDFNVISKFENNWYQEKQFEKPL